MLGIPQQTFNSHQGLPAIKVKKYTHPHQEEISDESKAQSGAKPHPTPSQPSATGTAGLLPSRSLASPPLPSLPILCCYVLCRGDVRVKRPLGKIRSRSNFPPSLRPLPQTGKKWQLSMITGLRGGKGGRASRKAELCRGTAYRWVSSSVQI